MQKVLLSMAFASASLLANAASDPFQWLEKVSDKKSLNWVKAQNNKSRSMLEKEAGFEPLKNQVLDILNSKERIAYVHKMGSHFYNFWRDGEHPRGLLRRTTPESYKTANPEWETVLDLDALSEKEKANWVYKNAECRYPQYDRCLISLSRGGADAVEIREFDLNTKEFVKNGFTLSEAKSEISWQGKDAVFVATDFGKGSQTDSGYPRIVKLWQRGTPLSSAQTIYEGQKSDISVSASVAEETGYRRELIRRGVTFYTSEIYLRSEGKLSRIAIPDDASLNFFGPQLVVTLKSDWTTGGKTWPAGSMLATDFNQFQAGARTFTPLFTPTPTTALNNFSVTKNYLLVDSLDNVTGRLAEWRFKEGQWTQRAVKVPPFGSISASAVDPDTSDDYFFNHTDFLTPDALYMAHAGSDERELLKQRPAFFDASQLEIAQYQAVSKDGTHVPYFIVKPKNLPADGSAPTLLYGYGGFEVSMTPAYSAGAGKAWLEKGGVFVMANIRGGGEFGPGWHQAALKENRQRAYDDFIAIAEDLISKKITRPEKLGIMGGSNGGLLMGVMMTQRPDLFGAVVCQVPLLDMQRFNKLLAGASWMGEYGNPDIPAEWDYIRKYSPYHNIRAGKKYPQILFTTSTRDDRVHPGHARKMMAKMQSMGIKTLWYYENMEGGHAGAADNKQKADMTALEYSFLWKMLK